MIKIHSSMYTVIALHAVIVYAISSSKFYTIACFISCVSVNAVSHGTICLAVTRIATADLKSLDPLHALKLTSRSEYTSTPTQISEPIPTAMMPPEIPTPSSNPQTPVTYAHNATESGSSSAQSSIVSAQDDNITNGNTYDGFTGRALSSPRSRSPSSQPQFSVKEPEKEAVLPHKARTTSAPVNASPVVTFTASSLEQLKNLPPKRELPWRAGLELTDDYEFKRPQQKGAVFLAARGEVQSQPCRICENGNGRFTLCVALDQYFGGACASCVFPSKGSQCTLRKDKEDGKFDVCDARSATHLTVTS